MFEEGDEGHAEGDEKIVFRYNRDERLRAARQIVRDYYDGKMNPVRGFKILWVNKSNRFILLSLIIFVGFVWVFTALNNTRSYLNVKGLTFNLTAFAYEEEIYASIKLLNKHADEKSPPVKVDALVFFVNADNQVVEKREMSLIYRNGEESLATKMADYDIIRVDAIITIEGKDKEISSPVKR